LGTLVQKIAVTEGGFLCLTSAEGRTFEARRVVFTGSIGVLQSGLVTFSPALPRPVLDAIAQLRMAVYTKVYLRWSERWWHSASGTSLLSTSHTSLLEETTPTERWPLISEVVAPSASNLGEPVLCATLVSDEGRRVEALADAEVCTELCAALHSALGVPIPEPEAIFVSRWSQDPLFCGSYSLLPVGCPVDVFAALQQPLLDDRLWLAGEAVHPRYSGYLHGAYLSGEDVARKLLSAASSDGGAARA